MRAVTRNIQFYCSGLSHSAFISHCGRPIL